VDSDVFFHGDTHVNEEFFDGISVVSGKDNLLFFWSVVFVFHFPGAFVLLVGLVLFSDVALAFEVLHYQKCTFLQNLTIFL
jgi:hypothetical protein